MPVKVLDLSRHLSGEGGILWMRCSLPSTMFVGCNLGKPFNHRQVAFVSPCPNCQGWIICSGLRILDEIMLIGFSIAMRSMGAPISKRTKSRASACSVCFSLNHRAPLTARCVHGG